MEKKVAISLFGAEQEIIRNLKNFPFHGKFQAIGTFIDPVFGASLFLAHNRNYSVNTKVHS